MRRLCDVPDCKREGIEDVADGFMCRWHALQWDKAIDRGGVFHPAEFIIADTTDDENLPVGECHSKWLGRTR